MNLESIIALAIANFALSVKPGPGSTLIVIRGMSGGFRSGYACAQGCNVVEMFYFLLVTISLGFAATYIDIATHITKTLGAAFLIYLGMTGLQKQAVEEDLEQKRRARSLKDSFLAGFALTLGNPLVILVYAGIIPTVIHIPSMTTLDILTGVGVVFVVNSFSLGMQAYCASFIGKFLMSPRRFRSVNIISNLMIIILGVLIGWSVFPNMNFENIFF